MDFGVGRKENLVPLPLKKQRPCQVRRTRFSGVWPGRFETAKAIRRVSRHPRAYGIEHGELMRQIYYSVIRIPRKARFCSAVVLLFATEQLASADGERAPQPAIATYRLVEIRNRVQPSGIAMFFSPPEKRDEYRQLRERARVLLAAISDRPHSPSEDKTQLLKDMDELNLIRAKLDLFHETFGWSQDLEGKAKILGYLRDNYAKDYQLILEEQTWRAIRDKYNGNIVGDLSVVDVTPEVIGKMLEAIGVSESESPDENNRINQSSAPRGASAISEFGKASPRRPPPGATQ